MRFRAANKHQPKKKVCMTSEKYPIKGAESSEPSKQSFNLSKSNKIYLGIAALITSGWLVMTSRLTDPYQLGRFIGNLIGLFLIPCIFSWIVWLLSKKKKSSGSFTFNLILTLVLIGRLGAYSIEAGKAQKLRNMEYELSVFKEKYDQPDDPEKINSAYTIIP